MLKEIYWVFEIDAIECTAENLVSNLINKRIVDESIAKVLNSNESEVTTPITHLQIDSNHRVLKVPKNKIIRKQ